MTPAEMKKTLFYKTLAPYIRKQDRNEFARMLSMVPEESVWDWSGFPNKKSNINDAFGWYGTPQGHSYWQELDMSLARSGAYKEAGL